MNENHSILPVAVSSIDIVRSYLSTVSRNRNWSRVMLPPVVRIKSSNGICNTQSTHLQLVYSQQSIATLQGELSWGLGTDQWVWANWVEHWQSICGCPGLGHASAELTAVTGLITYSIASYSSKLSSSGRYVSDRAVANPDCFIPTPSSKERYPSKTAERDEDNTT